MSCPVTLSLREMLDLLNADREKYGLVHTPHEILQQPETWKQTFRLVSDQAEDIREFLAGVENDGEAEVWLVGAGTSDYIAQSLLRLFRSNWKCRVEAVPSTDLLIEMDERLAAAPAKRRLWITFSRSGGTFESCSVIEGALEKYPNIRHLIVTCAAEGKMAVSLAAYNENVYGLVLDDSVNDRGVAMTSSFTNMLVAGHCLANLADLECYRSILDQVSGSAEKNLDGIAAVAKLLSDGEHRRIYFLGNGALKGIADECALKVLEYTAGQINTMSGTFLSVRHGPLSWFDDSTLAVALLSGDAEKATFEVGLLKQIKEEKLARTTLAVVPHANESATQYADHVFDLGLSDAVSEDYLTLIGVIFGQCLGAYSSLRCDLRPDQPSDHGPVQRVISGISVA